MCSSGGGRTASRVDWRAPKRLPKTVVAGRQEGVQEMGAKFSGHCHPLPSTGRRDADAVASEGGTDAAGVTTRPKPASSVRLLAVPGK